MSATNGYTPVKWLCTCGMFSRRYTEYCDQCGKPRPFVIGPDETIDARPPVLGLDGYGRPGHS
jgi:hypothetical protein